MISLYKVSKVCWAVTTRDNIDTQVFKTIEDTSDFLESIGVLDEQIDLALINLIGNDHTHAEFNNEGKFAFSDETRLNELLGVA